MRKLLLASAAAVALSSGAALATSDVESVQLNIGSPQVAKTVKEPVSTSKTLKVGGNLDISTTAVGNSLSVTDLGMKNLTNIQGNIGSSQTASTPLVGLDVGKDATVSTTAVGNTASVSGGYADNLSSLQGNLFSGQTAATVIGGVEVGGKLDVTTAAVGNNVSMENTGNVGMPISFIGQVNAFSGQSASTDVIGVAADKGMSIDTQAVGNNASISAHRDVDLGLSGQANIFGGQIARTSMFLTATDKADVAVNTLAVGNNLSVTSDTGNARVGGGLLSGQVNLLAPQTATTDVSLAFGTKNLDLSTTAAGNVASVQAGYGEGDTATLGGKGLLPGDDYVQANIASPQFAATTVNFAPVKLDATVSTTAIGNAINLGGYKVIADTVQVNAFSPQTALTTVNFGGSGVGGNLNISTTAVGNSVSINGKK